MRFCLKTLLLVVVAFPYTFVGAFFYVMAQEPDYEPPEPIVIEKIVVETETIYMHPFGTPKDPYKEELHGKVECSCVRTARSLGLDIPYGTDAIDMKPNTAEISVGVGVLFAEKNGHIAVVTKIEEDGFWIEEGDYVDCERTERLISFEDPKLIGYYK